MYPVAAYFFSISNECVVLRHMALMSASETMKCVCYAGIDFIDIFSMCVVEKISYE